MAIPDMSIAVLEPAARPLNNVSPSMASEVEACPRKVGYGQDPVFQGLRKGTPSSALGQVVHAVLTTQPGDTFEESWRTAEATAFDRLRRAWSPATPPAPYRWPGWALARARARARWVPITARRGGGGARDAKVGVPPLPWVERRLEHPDLPLFGQPDVVEQIDGELLVRDFKTGKVDAGPGGSSWRQLLLYCALVEVVLGRLPDVMVIDTLNVRHRADVHRPAVDDAVAAALSLRAAYNASAADGLVAGAPGPETCRFCPFRLVCEPFLSTVGADWGVGLPLVGTVDAVDEAVTLRLEWPSWSREQFVTLIGFPFPDGVARGQRWGVLGAAPRGSTAVAGWSSVVYRWS
ncbi:PD-(D/E)XK nuclease family protein [Aquipuribacter sp. MA13-6]|uniref:PD-(D/E)XK nuclease family protein n=2 Tax=unclassified Aquipuribacter TaxID=2635084 RepID=UPI003F492517